MDDFVTEFGAELRAAAHRRARRARVPRALLAAAVAAALLAAVLLAPGDPEREAAPAPAPAVGAEAPVSVDLRSVFGSGRREPTAFDSHPTLVVFGASWCGPCVDDLPAVRSASQYVADAGGELLYVATKDRLEDVRRMGFPSFLRPSVVFDADGSYARAWRARSLPFAAVVDPQRRVVARRAGPLDLEWLVRQLARVRAAGSRRLDAVRAAYAVLRDRSTIVPPPPFLQSLVHRQLAGHAETHLVFRGNRYRFWVALALGGQCTLVMSRGGGGGGGCGPLDDTLVEEGFGPSFSRIRVDVLVPDGTRDARLEWSDGRRRPVTIHGNAIVEHYDEVPDAISWVTPDGRRVRHALGEP